MRLTFRLSESADPDLISKMEEIPKRDRSRTIRDALRDHFFGSNTNTPGETAAAPQLQLQLSGDDLREEDLDPDDKIDDFLDQW